MVKKNLMLKKLNEDNIDEIMSLQDDIFSELQAENFLRKNSKENFIKCLQEPSYTIGLYDGNKLIGLTILADVKDTEESLSKSIISANINNAINCKLTVIRKEYSGNGFQRDMHWLREKLAYKNGFKYLCTSVDPNNHFSRNNIIKTGFIYDHTQENMEV